MFPLRISNSVFKPSTFSTFRAHMSSVASIKYSSESPGPLEKTIVDKLVAQLQPQSLVVHNDSHKHAGHHGLRGATNITESHFRIEIVSDAFAQHRAQPNRHRLVYGILDHEMKNEGLHALQLKTKTPAEASK